MTFRRFAIQSAVGMATGVVLASLLTRYLAAPLIPPSKNMSGTDVPRVLVQLSTRNFGRVDSGTVIEATFHLKNDGNRRLILRRTSGRCQCFIPDEPETVIEPGEQHVITRNLDTSNCSGSLQREWNYATNDPSQPLISLVGIADVVPP